VTRDELRALREDLGMTGAQLADVLGVSRPTLWRWEQRGMEKADPSSRRVLLLLHRKLPREQRAEAGKAAADALLVGGALRGLYVLLHAVYK
jgi:transcriptional regulator with XRE-family HTH domain